MSDLRYSFSRVYNTGNEIISVVVYILLNIVFTFLFLMTFVDSPHLLSTFLLSTFLLSTLDFFYSRLFTLDSRLLPSTLDNYSRLLDTLDQERCGNRSK